MQHVLPAYRHSVFEEIRRLSNEDNHVFELWHSHATGSFARRGTEGSLDWARVLPIHGLRFGKVELFWQTLPWRDVFSADVIIVPDASRNLTNLAVIVVRRVLRKPVLTWGHGANFQPDGLSRFFSSLRYRLVRLANGHLVYTKTCVGPLVANGVDIQRIGVTENAIDASAAGDLHAGHAEVLAFRERHRLGEGPCFVFLGSWYARKRPERIIQFGEALQSNIPGAKVLVIGGGDGVSVLKAKCPPWLVLLGPLHGRQKYVALCAARCLVVSGVAGLNLLDAMAVGLPIVVPERNDHSPEIDYVNDGVNGFVVPDDIGLMVAACKRLNGDATLRNRMCASARKTYSTHSVERMAGNIYGFAVNAALGDFDTRAY
ncbi:MAG: glycosyltransferase family 4 protein [Lewinella sp.]|nr:glycosyltransferase family 4 protein [Lewinella sp.]